MSEEIKAELERMENLPEPELRKLAVEFIEGRIFTTQHLPDGQESDAFMVFLPLALMGREQAGRFLTNCGMIYEDYSKAGPTSCNGMPCFFSMRKLTIPDTQRMLRFAREYREIQAKFMAEPPAKHDPSQTPQS